MWKIKKCIPRKKDKHIARFIASECSTYNYFITNYGNNKHEICSIIRKFISFWSYINNCDRHFSWKMCSKPLKKHSNRKKAVLNLCGVMISNIVDGLSKLLCDPLPYLKTKKNDLITTYAKRGTTTVHYLKLICDRRCTTMSFVYFLNVWVINLDNKGYWMTESEWKIVHRPTHYFRWGQRGFKTFRPSVREKVFVELLLFKF